MIYIIVFIISITLMKLSEYEEDGRRKRLIIFSALPLIILGTIRDSSIGIDVGTYQLPMFNVAMRSKTITEYFSNYMILQFEPLYSLIIYLGSRFADIAGAFFIETLLIVILTYKTILHFADDIPPHFALACYLFLFYLHGYNLNRQFIAISFVLYSVALLDKSSYLYSGVCLILAILSHSSAVFGVPILFLYIISKRKIAWAYTVFLTLAVSILSIYFRQIFIFVVSKIPMLNKRYISNSYLYLNRGVDVYWSELIITALVLGIMLLLIITSGSQYVNNFNFLLYMALLSVCNGTIGSQANTAARIFMYSEVFSIFVLPRFSDLVSEKGYNRLISNMVIYGVISIYCIYNFFIYNHGEVYPYMISSTIFK